MALFFYTMIEIFARYELLIRGVILKPSEPESVVRVMVLGPDYRSR